MNAKYIHVCNKGMELDLQLQIFIFKSTVIKYLCGEDTIKVEMAIGTPP